MCRSAQQSPPISSGTAECFAKITPRSSSWTILFKRPVYSAEDLVAIGQTLSLAWVISLFLKPSQIYRKQDERQEATISKLDRLE
jgi:hypothetical protein